MKIFITNIRVKALIYPITLLLMLSLCPSVGFAGQHSFWLIMPMLSFGGPDGACQGIIRPSPLLDINSKNGNLQFFVRVRDPKRKIAYQSPIFDQTEPIQGHDLFDLIDVSSIKYNSILEVVSITEEKDAYPFLRIVSDGDCFTVYLRFEKRFPSPSPL